MGNNIDKISAETAVRIAGFGLLAMFGAGILDAFTGASSLILWNDAPTTFSNLQGSLMRYRLSDLPVGLSAEGSGGFAVRGGGGVPDRWFCESVVSGIS